MKNIKPTLLFFDDKSLAPAQHDIYVPEDESQTIIIIYAGVQGKQTITLRIGEQACAHLVVMPLLCKEQSLELVVNQVHEASHASSDVHILGALTGQAKIHIVGMTQSVPQANDVKAIQQSHILLLSPHAHVTTMPSIQNITMNVHCVHGAAISTYDSAQFIYAQSRGLSDCLARSILLESFLLSWFPNILSLDCRTQFMQHIQQGMALLQESRTQFCDSPIKPVS